MDFMFIELKDYICKFKVTYVFLKFLDFLLVFVICIFVFCLFLYSKLGIVLLIIYVEIGRLILKVYFGVIFGNLIILSREVDDFYYLYILGVRYFIFFMICVKNFNFLEFKS